MLNKNQLYQLFFSFLIFTLPANLFLKLSEKATYVNGLQIDYLIPKLYLSDILIFLIFLVWLGNQLRSIKLKTIFLRIKKSLQIITNFIKKNPLLSSLLLIFATRHIFTNYPLASGWYLLKILEFVFLSLFIFKNKEIFAPKKFQKIIFLMIVFTLTFQSLVALYQNYTQTSLAGYLFFGEPNLDHSLGLAKNTFNGIEKILPYGTTAHPNILGGISAIYLLAALNYVFKNSPKALTKVALIITILIPSYVLYLTHSLSAWLAFAIGLILSLFQKNFTPAKASLQKIILVLSCLIVLAIPLLISFSTRYNPQNPSLYRRSYLSTAALKMFKKTPLVGVGLNNFTTRVEKYSQNREVARFSQPVHNIGLLFLSETGLLGILILSILIYKLLKKSNSNILLPIFTLLPLAALDHYLLTTQSGMLLLIFTLSLLKRSASEKNISS